jgi:alanine-glyoxylate transaminase/serine-glyoxylate transaminase/serine-pyruvate transaminase
LPVIAGRGVIVAGGLHPSIQATYFRVGHMGSIVDRPAELAFALDAIGGALRSCGHDADIEAGIAAASALLTPPSDPESPS